MKKLIIILLIVALLVPFTTWSKVLEVPKEQQKRMLKIPKIKKETHEYYYFTQYNLVTAQTDSTPCIWASTKNICDLNNKWIRTIALTVDIRKKNWIKRWDKVELLWDKWCSWVYEVHDEMNKRFRTWCIKRSWVCIKWDIVNWAWWVCRVKKI